MLLLARYARCAAILYQKQRFDDILMHVFQCLMGLLATTKAMHVPLQTIAQDYHVMQSCKDEKIYLSNSSSKSRLKLDLAWPTEKSQIVFSAIKKKTLDRHKKILDGQKDSHLTQKSANKKKFFTGKKTARTRRNLSSLTINSQRVDLRVDLHLAWQNEIWVCQTKT